MISGGAPGPHKIQGIGAGFIPKVLETDKIDEIIKVDNDDAFKTARLLAKTDGIPGGISTGANVWAALQVAKRARSGRQAYRHVRPVVRRALSLDRAVRSGLSDEPACKR